MKEILIYAIMTKILSIKIISKDKINIIRITWSKDIKRKIITKVNKQITVQILSKISILKSNYLKMMKWKLSCTQTQTKEII